jgi:hypothetical protein
VDGFLSKLEHVRPIGIDAKAFYRDAAATGYTDYKTGILFGTDGGGRYSPPKEFPVLYFSADPLACALEVAHHARLLTPIQNVAQDAVIPLVRIGAGGRSNPDPYRDLQSDALAQSQTYERPFTSP